MPGSRRRQVVLFVVVMGLSLPLAVVAAVLEAQGLTAAATVVALADAVWVAATQTAEFVQRRRSATAQRPSTEDLARAKDVLAGLVQERWKDEAASRGLDRPFPMPVRWRLAIACSPTQRISAWVVLCRRFQRLSRRPRNGTRMWRPAPWYALSAQHLIPDSAKASTMPWARAAVRSWVEPGRAT
ncbi:hypothetical protein [Streptomyces sp. NBC_00190]|uniref:hypothetical protein n=1 Tax=Streptomyces sp. NBC_00190 TaxID=2903634 RepID=UPI003FA68E6D